MGFGMSRRNTNLSLSDPGNPSKVSELSYKSTNNKPEVTGYWKYPSLGGAVGSASDVIGQLQVPREEPFCLWAAVIHTRVINVIK